MFVIDSHKNTTKEFKNKAFNVKKPKKSTKEKESNTDTKNGLKPVKKKSQPGKKENYMDDEKKNQFLDSERVISSLFSPEPGEKTFSDPDEISLIIRVS